MSKLVEMEFEELCAFKRKLVEQKEFVDSKLLAVNQILDGQYESVCHICDTHKYAFDDIPAGWGWLVSDTNPVLLCDRCIAKWENKWVVCRVTRGEDV